MKKEFMQESLNENTQTTLGDTNQKQVGKKEGKSEFEARQEEFKKFENRICNLCCKEFDFEKDWDSENMNYKIVETRNLSGYSHKKCRGNFTRNLIERPVRKQFFDKNFNII